MRRYVLDQFSDTYITTIGAKVSKKELRLEIPGGRPLVVNLTIWDIMGNPSFRELLRDAYFGDAQVILAVTDLTRRETLDSLSGWVEAVTRAVGPVPTVVATNKADLASDASYAGADAVRTAEAFGGEVFATSAKTGENVEAAFRRLAGLIVEAQLRRPRA